MQFLAGARKASPLLGQGATVSINCGNCKGQHATTLDVRDCCTTGRFITRPVRTFTSTEAFTAPVFEAPEATEKQIGFIATLAAERTLDPVERQAIEAKLSSGTMTKSEASKTITNLLARAKAPVAAATPAPVPQVPDGRYALDFHGDGMIRFYQVASPTTGRWAGRTFVKIQAGDDLHSLHGKAAVEALVAIAADPEAASRLYGRQIGSCGRCGRTLTDAASRAAGIGPVCADKGW